MNDRPYLVGVDIGGTTTDATIVDRRTQRTSHLTIPTAAAGGAAVVASSIKAIDSLVEQAGAQGSEIAAIGLGSPGQVQPETGTVRLATNLGIDAEGYPIAAAIANHYGTPTAIENDVRAAALGLWDHEALKPHILTYLSIGTGISAGTVVDGTLLRGSRGVAGELGQIPVMVRAGAGMELVSTERAAAGPAIGEAAAAAAVVRDRFFMTDAARPALEVIARVVHTIFMTYDPDVLYVGGGVARSIGFRAALITVVDDVRARVDCGFVDVFRISPIDPGFHPGTAGAIHLAKQATEESGRRRRPAKQEETP